MEATRTVLRPSALAFTLTLFFCLPAVPLRAAPRIDSYWQVDDIRVGMKGQGRTVMKGTRIENFDAEVLGVLKNSSPGRDLILCRLSGLNLEKTGVIAGMSGSPIYIDGKLLGAVSYGYPYGKEPIAGVTPFSQMHGCVEAFERRDLAEDGKPRRVGLRTPVTVEGVSFDSVSVSQGFDAPPPAADSLCLVPLRTPVAGTGFTAASLALLGDRLHDTGLLPMQGGGTTAHVAAEAREAPLQPGSPLAVALIQGDFDLSGIGTVTHVEGRRVYGWGHPFLGLGTCDFPLMTGYIHTVFPRQSVSFKMGSPLETVGLINADVSTGIAGWLDRKPQLLPLAMTLTREGTRDRTFHVEVVREQALVATLVLTALANSVDLEGDLPEEMTTELRACIELEGHEPIIIQDTFSGPTYSGSRAPQTLYTQVAATVHQLVRNPFAPVQVNRISCDTHVEAGRRTAEIESAELVSEAYAPGETLQANVYLRPYKGNVERLPVHLALPADLPEGNYTLNVCDDLTNARAELHDNPNLNDPKNLDQLLRALKVQTAVRRTNLVLRVPLLADGVAFDGKALPNLPPSMVQILGNTRKTGAQTTGKALVSRCGTDWVVLGSETLHFTVTRHKKVLAQP